MHNPSTASPQTWQISALVRYSLYGLYWTLLTPLPFLAQLQGLPLVAWGLGVGLIAGFVGIHGLLSQQVQADHQGLRITYPAWVPSWLASGWRVNWTDIQRLHTRPTGQGGRVHYLVTHSGQAYLIPMRVAGFGRLLDTISRHTGLPTADIKPLAQPWMYAALGLCVLILLPLDAWLILQVFSAPSGFVN
ncbi:MAG: hypothetical protein RMI89_06225 [Gloeomargarita sp. SKYBB_i_bin120]|nr:hypothetical protein [Gloeomargarita sp. SKYB120]MDW8178121.1 hypothetical protein [Gloeomargarita sp. SKYBB_i_bin120]